MSSPILPVEDQAHDPGLPSTVPTATVANADAVEFVAALAAGTGAPPQAAHGGPPAEVLRQMRAAGALAERLREDGYQLRFLTTECGERTVIELQDAGGRAVRVLTAAEAVELAVSAFTRPRAH